MGKKCKQEHVGSARKAGLSGENSEAKGGLPWLPVVMNGTELCLNA